MTEETRDAKRTYGLGICGKKIKRVVGYVLTHAVLMAISYHAAELWGSVVNPVAQIWLAVTASIFMFIGMACLIAAIMTVAAGEESQR